MRYSLYTVLEKIGELVVTLRNYNELSDRDVENILQSYGEVLWDKNGKIFFAIESIQNPNTFCRRVASLESPDISLSDDWDVSKSQFVTGLRNDNDFVIYLYVPNRDYINRLDNLIKYLPDGAVLDCVIQRDSDSDFNSDFED